MKERHRLNRCNSRLILYYLVFVVLGGLVILSFTVAMSPAAPTSTRYIRNSSTGGDCASMGVWDQYSKTCTLTTDLSFSGANGIEIMDDGITLDGGGHTITGAGGFASGGSLSVRSNVTIRNLTVKDFGYGIFLLSSNGNTVTGNRIEGNGTGLNVVFSSNNTIHGNSFVNNTTQAVVTGGSGNLFHLPAPGGGNYWSDWTVPDANNDGFVDTPYTFTGGQDDLPLTGPPGACSKPGLRLSVRSASWLTYTDYNERLLTIQYRLMNDGPGGAFSTRMTSSSCTNGVTAASPMPVAAGDIDTGSWSDFTAGYIVPQGVTGFRATNSATATGSCGLTFDYP